jgi:hypothetical protein
MGEKKMNFFSFFFNQLVAESAYTGSSVNNDDIITFGPDLDAGGVSAVFEVLFS